MRFTRLRQLTIWTALACVVWFLAFIPTASAQTRDHVWTRNAVQVARHEVIEDVVVLANNAWISGDVYEALVVLNGDVHLRSTARVGILVDIGGHVYKSPGAHVNAEYVVSTQVPFWNSVLLGVSMLLFEWAARVVLSAAMVLVPLSLAFLARRRLDSTVSMMQRSLRRSGLSGLLFTAGAVVIAGALGITVVGAPLGALVVLVYLIAGVLGWTAVCVWLSRILADAFAFQTRSRWLNIGLAAAVLMAFTNVPVVGIILFLAFWSVGLGAFVVSVLRWFQRRRQPRATA